MVNRIPVISFWDTCQPWWCHQIKPFPRYWPFVWGTTVHHWTPHPQKLVTRSFGVYFGLPLNKRLSKQSRRRWFETPSYSFDCDNSRNGGMSAGHKIYHVEQTCMISQCGRTKLPSLCRGHFEIHFLEISFVFQFNINWKLSSWPIDNKSSFDLVMTWQREGLNQWWHFIIAKMSLKGHSYLAWLHALALMDWPPLVSAVASCIFTAKLSPEPIIVST